MKIEEYERLKILMR